MSKPSYELRSLQKDDFDAVINLGNDVHGEGYLDHNSLSAIYKRGLKDDLNASYVLYDKNTLIGFRLSYAPGQWELDEWCTTELWPEDVTNVAYFKCNTIHPDYQGQGLGGQLLKVSVDTLKQMGATAGLSHIWMQSPGNASFKYFTKAGGQLIKTHERRWFLDPKFEDYVCVLCGKDCYCSASEMMLVFK